jgi:hypothetical protein
MMVCIKDYLRSDQIGVRLSYASTSRLFVVFPVDDVPNKGEQVLNGIMKHILDCTEALFERPNVWQRWWQAPPHTDARIMPDGVWKPWRSLRTQPSDEYLLWQWRLAGLRTVNIVITPENDRANAFRLNHIEDVERFIPFAELMVAQFVANRAVNPSL